MEILVGWRGLKQKCPPVGGEGVYGYFLELHIIWRSRSLWQIIDLRDADKSQYFAITEFDIVLSFDHQVCFLMNILGKRSDLPFFTQERS